MLPIKKIDRIRSLYFDEGLKMVEIARKVRCSPNTVSKYVKNFDYSPKPKKCSNGLSEKILPYEDDIKELLKKERNGHYKQRLLDFAPFLRGVPRRWDTQKCGRIDLPFRCRNYKLSCHLNNTPLYIVLLAQVGVFVFLRAKTRKFTLQFNAN